MCVCVFLHNVYNYKSPTLAYIYSALKYFLFNSRNSHDGKITCKIKHNENNPGEHDFVH